MPDALHAPSVIKTISSLRHRPSWPEAWPEACTPLNRRVQSGLSMRCKKSHLCSCLRSTEGLPKCSVHCRAPADRPGRFEAQLYITLAERKMRRFCQYAALYPESCFILIGDNGQVRQPQQADPPTAQAAMTSTDNCSQGAMRGALSACCCNMACHQASVPGTGPVSKASEWTFIITWSGRCREASCLQRR